MIPFNHSFQPQAESKITRIHGRGLKAEPNWANFESFLILVMPDKKTVKLHQITYIRSKILYELVTNICDMIKVWAHLLLLQF